MYRYIYIKYTNTLIMREAVSSRNVLDSSTLKDCNVWAKEKTDLIFDEYKTFDMFKSYNFTQEYLKKNDRIFFGGAYQDSTLHLLSKSGYCRLVGMDFKEDIYNQPDYWKIKFYRGNIINTHLPSNLFKAYFSLSVIEHLDSNGGDIFTMIDIFLQEAARITQNDGFLVLTTDYNNISVRKKGENIFNKMDIVKIIDIARNHGFDLISDLNFDINDKPVIWNGHNYTFIFLAFKLHKIVNPASLTKVNIISPMKKQDGITIYAENLRKRFEQIGIEVNLVANYKDCNLSYPTIFEYEPSLLQNIPYDKNIFIEMHSTKANLKTVAGVFLNTHSFKKSLQFFKNILFIRAHRKNIIRSSDLTSKFFLNLKSYIIMPHIAYPDSGIRADPDNICIGSFGFAFPDKNFDQICELAIRLNVKCVLLLSINNSTKGMFEVTSRTISQLKEKYNKYENITMRVGFFTDKEILEQLKVCSHIIFAQNNSGQTSGSYRFPVQLGIPIIATDSFQARESQIIRVNKLDDLDLQKLKSFKDSINLDDGFEYLINILSYDYS